MSQPPHRHRKRFGQHFLHDPGTLNRIHRAINPQPDEHVIEIGPGQGALTTLIVDQVRQLDAIEIDRDLADYLQRHFTQPQFTLHVGDALTFDYPSLLQRGSVRVIGNLPYNISTPLLFTLYEHADLITDMHFLLQKEVVDRMTAQAGSSAYGRLSVMTQYFCQAQNLFNVANGAFTPPPKVTSSVVKLVPHRASQLTASNFRHFAFIVREAFNHRRKTIHNAIKGFVQTDTFTKLDINPNTRPQQLTLQDYIRISEYNSVE